MGPHGAALPQWRIRARPLAGAAPLGRYPLGTLARGRGRTSTYWRVESGEWRMHVSRRRLESGESTLLHMETTYGARTYRNFVNS